TIYWDYVIIEEFNKYSDLAATFSDIGCRSERTIHCFDIICKSNSDRALDRPLNKVMILHLSNFQYILNHPDIHLCIIDQIKIIQTQFNSSNNAKLISDRLDSLQFCIFQQKFQILLSNRDVWRCANLLCVISVKLNEQQLDDVFEFFMDGLFDEGYYIHENCASSIAKIALKLNERQLNKVFKCLMNININFSNLFKMLQR
ncbi:hypothetical protein RFI_37329, partial [Reticulomyxa filosa]